MRNRKGYARRAINLRESVPPGRRAKPNMIKPANYVSDVTNKRQIQWPKESDVTANKIQPARAAIVDDKLRFSIYGRYKLLPLFKVDAAATPPLHSRAPGTSIYPLEIYFNSCVRAQIALYGLRPFIVSASRLEYI
ncbi:hypothetical protein EVAR_75650_1 [Eumeta japonica]|uniref:Uncharacterized protein n=1 Tax=Eumeta variegata TaxID=151549 RepID=A0A4C1U0F7_EUMVA|nr:hypothetical protein EVAR_75650_1 [Eumeta japonica]